METYRVVWEIEIEAGSFEEAAQEAREAQLDPTNIATVFSVSNDKGETRTVDLLKDEG